MIKFKQSKITDSKNKLYRTGDIVFNPCFGDIWLVHKYTKHEKELYTPGCDYCFCQYGVLENYFMDLDEPEGFVIIKRKGQKGYYKLLHNITRWGKDLWRRNK